MQKLAYTLPEAAIAAATSRSELYRAAQRDELKFIKRGRRTLILADELRRWVEALPPKAA